jgi:predicted nucleic acid-binding protein
MTIFTDSGAFVALLNPSDMYHETAKAFFFETRDAGVKFTTTNYVLCETMNYLRNKVSSDAAVDLRESLIKSPLFGVTWITPSMEDAAFAIFKKYSDKNFSFTDCTSFAVMEAMRIKKAFAFDRHFEQYGGFTRLPAKG